MAFMGIIQVVLNARTILHNMDDCKKNLLKFKPDVLILIDYPSFNLRIAKFVKEQIPATPVYYYISPKIWAWKEYRIKEIKKYIDKMYTILPFETDFYKKHNYQVEYVGNPSVDSVAFRANKEEPFDTFTSKNGLNNKPIVALLAGSRKQEIQGCLLKMVKVSEHYPNYQFIVAGAPSISPELYQSIIGNYPIKVVYGQTYDLLQQSYAAIVNSGTATLETALFRVPQVVVYHQQLGFIMNILKAIVLKVKYVSLVNLIFNGNLVTELIAAEFTSKKLLREFRLLLESSSRKKILDGYDSIIQKLGEPGAAKHAAEKMVFSLSKE
jgi:lipid-A-disaccharide synthase